MKDHVSRRAATALLAFAMTVFASITFAGAVQQVQPGDGDGGGSMMCKNCGPNYNVQTKSGTATGGYANTYTDGESDLGMYYTTPNDGSTYSGTQSIVVTDVQGDLLYNYTASFTNPGDGGQYVSGLSGLPYLPTGSSISVSVTGSNSNGTSFSATWNLRNYHP
jgi:hypothetical protein